MPITIPDNAPFTGAQRMWLKGFLDGISSCLPSQRDAAAPPVASHAQGPQVKGLPVTILWGSQTGTAETYAKKMAKALTQKGHTPSVVDMAGADIAQLAAVENLLVITSTYGDGEPPDNAAAFHKELHATDATLGHLVFSVFALGDSNYPDFCKCGRDFQSRFEAMGASPLQPITESDVDHDGPFAKWSGTVLELLASRTKAD